MEESLEVLYPANSSGSFLSRDLLRDFVRFGIETLQRLPPWGGRRRRGSPGTSLVFASTSLGVLSLEIAKGAEMVAAETAAVAYGCFEREG